MKAFHFPLETVLKLKQHREESLRIALGQVVSQIQRVQSQKADTYHRIATAASMTETNFRWVAQYCRRLNADIASYNHQLQQLKADKQQAQDHYLQALNEVKAYEKLKEKKEALYRRRLRQDECKKTDEINQFKQNRERMNGR